MSKVTHMDAAPRQESGSPRRGKEVVAVLAGLALAAVVGLGAWLVFRGDSGTEAISGTTAVFGPTIVDEATLRTETAGVGHTVYWMPPEGRSLELTILQDGTVHVGYLPADAAQADSATSHAIVSSWPMTDPLGRAELSAASEGAMSREEPGGALIVAGSDSPFNAYVAQPNTTALGEVYDPEPGQAWRTVNQGKVSVLQP